MLKKSWLLKILTRPNVFARREKLRAPLTPLSRADFDSEMERLLDRQCRHEENFKINAALSDKVVLVTGAGGSIGSEIVRQVSRFNPRRIILLDNSELNLFKLKSALESEKIILRCAFLLLDITDEARINRVLAETQPDIIFHAAAYKHVPLVESNVYAGFRSNVIGTDVMVRASLRNNVERFLLISSDKAVDPANVMGLCKSLAEKIVFARGCNTSVTSPLTIMTIVRFANVINSSGSVIPIFRKQIQRGGPVTVTHPKMERYFMSVREAVALVLNAGLFGENLVTYTLDMGKKIKIHSLAKKMIAQLSSEKIKIVFTGLREGERLSESLYSAKEKILRTAFPKIFRIEASAHLDSARFLAKLDLIKAKYESCDDLELAKDLYDLNGNCFMGEQVLSSAIVAVNARKF